MLSIQYLLREKYKNQQTKDFFIDAKKIKNGEPVDYVIGHIPFLDCRIDLSCHPFIPRPETEFWVQNLIERIKNQCKTIRNPMSDNSVRHRVSKSTKNQQQNSLRCLDLFSGSGCIGIALLTKLPFVKVDFGDKEEICLKQIKKNLLINKVDLSRVSIIKTDVFSNISKRYDYIIANPPYISRLRQHFVQASVLNWEPHQALFAEDEGLYFIKQILTQGPDYLLAGGKIIDPLRNNFSLRNEEIFTAARKDDEAVYEEYTLRRTDAAAVKISNCSRKDYCAAGLIIEFDSCQKRQIENFLAGLDYYDFEFQRDQYERWRTVIARLK